MYHCCGKPEITGKPTSWDLGTSVGLTCIVLLVRVFGCRRPQLTVRVRMSDGSVKRVQAKSRDTVEEVCERVRMNVAVASLVVTPVPLSRPESRAYLLSACTFLRPRPLVLDSCSGRKRRYGCETSVQFFYWQWSLHACLYRFFCGLVLQVCVCVPPLVAALPRSRATLDDTFHFVLAFCEASIPPPPSLVLLPRV